jgi:hypothetical protein
MPASSALNPTVAFSSLSEPPPSQSIQFYDGFFPSLPAGNYTLQITHTLANTPTTVAPFSITQSVMVSGPEFTLPPGTVQSVYPPATGTGDYGQELPYIVLDDPTLPWERSLTPGSALPGSGTPTPWLALVVFAEDEIIFPAGSSPVSTTPVSTLLTGDPNTLKPQFPSDCGTQPLQQTQCQTITIPGATFQAVLPKVTDLGYLAHARTVNVANEGQVLVSCLLSNRLPTVTTPTRFYAHLISLEGFAAYLGPSGTPIPKNAAGTGLVNVQLVSLYNWSFTGLSSPAVSFETLVQGLIAGQAQESGFCLPVPAGQTGLPPAVTKRLAQGYAPLSFVMGSGETSFAWYRGPLSPVVPQPLPTVGNPPVAVGSAVSSDALMIYLAEQGIFDLSYAAAWQIGRSLALGDSGFTQALWQLRRSARQILANAVQCAASPWWNGVTAAELIENPSVYDLFTQLMAGGLGETWTELTSAPASSQAGSGSSTSQASATANPPITSSTLLANAQVVAALAQQLGSLIGPVSSFLAQLPLLTPIPFSHLVPDARMLPVESIRFFHIDPNWLAALQAGALSLCLQGSADVAIQTALMPQLTAAVAPAPVAGVLIRSQLVSGWPTMVVTPTAGGNPVKVLRDDTLAANVRMVLFNAVPDKLVLSEPYQGLRFGIEDNGIALRGLAAAGAIGAQVQGIFLPKTGGAPAFLQAYTVPAQAGSPSYAGVLNVSGLAADLTTALQGAGAAPPKGFGAGEFATQMVEAPEAQTFPSASGPSAPCPSAP